MMRTHILTLSTLLALLWACDAKDDELEDEDLAAEPAPTPEHEGDTDADADADTGADPDADDGPDPEPDPEDPEPEPEEPDPEEDPPAEPETCTVLAEAEACTLPDGAEGTRFCAPIGQAEALVWGSCLEHVRCMPGEFVHCGECPGGGETGGLPPEEECPDFGSACVLDGDEPWPEESHRETCSTPLVLSFDGAPVRMSAAPAATFDIDTVGACTTTDWPSAATPWLALDLDRSGSIEAGHELFGSGTRLPSGARASNGFSALAALDENGDGRISAADPRFAELVLWADHDADKAATFAELEPLGVRGILSIELDYTIDRRCDDRGNCEVERASFTFIDRGGAVNVGDVVDIHLACQ